MSPVLSVGVLVSTCLRLGKALVRSSARLYAAASFSVGGANLSSSSSTAMHTGRELMFAGELDPTSERVMVVNCISKILKSSLSNGNSARTGLHFSKMGVSRVSLYDLARSALGMTSNAGAGSLAIRYASQTASVSVLPV